MSSTSTKIAELVTTFQDEDGKFESGNKAAGTRARKALMEIKKACDTRRKEIQSEKNEGSASA
jgi:Histone H1-like protein Hc1